MKLHCNFLTIVWKDYEIMYYSLYKCEKINEYTY